MDKYSFIKLVVCMSLASCSTHKNYTFSNQQWHVDNYSGHAVSNRGESFAFGSEWMITDTTLIDTDQKIAKFPKLASYLAKGIAKFPEIEVDSILFYNPHRGLLFVEYHQLKPLKPTSDISLYDKSIGVYSREYAELFGNQYTYSSIDDTGWENGPKSSVYTNVRYRPKEKQVVLLQRLPSVKNNVAIIQIMTTIPRRGKWWEDYPRGTFRQVDLGDLENIEHISLALQASRNLAVENLKIILQQKD